MIKQFPFGILSDGREVTCYRLDNGRVQVDLLDYGAVIQAIRVPDRNGDPVDIALGFETAQGYEFGHGCLGATVGRHANRIGGAEFTLNGVTYHLEKNNGPNHIHGGTDSYYRRLFSGAAKDNEVRFSLFSPDGDQGYPGSLQLTVVYALSEDDTLSVRFLAECDQDTVLNLTNHSYFDLSGGADPMGQLLRLEAAYFCENDANTLPTGKLLPVEGTAFDFRTFKPIGADLSRDEVQLRNCGGYDHNFVLDKDGSMAHSAVLRSPETGIEMTLSTDLPGLQLYSANSLHADGKRPYGPRQAVCLEPQFFPNAMAIDGFEKPILRAGDTFDRRIAYHFSAF